MCATSLPSQIGCLFALAKYLGSNLDYKSYNYVIHPYNNHMIKELKKKNCKT